MARARRLACSGPRRRDVARPLSSTAWALSAAAKSLAACACRSGEVFSSTTAGLGSGWCRRIAFWVACWISACWRLVSAAIVGSAVFCSTSAAAFLRRACSLARNCGWLGPEQCLSPISLHGLDGGGLVSAGYSASIVATKSSVAAVISDCIAWALVSSRAAAYRFQAVAVGLEGRQPLAGHDQDLPQLVGVDRLLPGPADRRRCGNRPWPGRPGRPRREARRVRFRFSFGSMEFLLVVGVRW